MSNKATLYWAARCGEVINDLRRARCGERLKQWYAAIDKAKALLGKKEDN